MSDYIGFASEAIINWPKVNIDKEKFECCLYFTQESYDKNLKEAFEAAKKEFKKATIKLKKIDDESKEISKILGTDYVFQHTAKSKLSIVKCVDLYKNALEISSLKSGDKVYVKGTLKETENPENHKQKYVTFYANLIAKVQEKAFDLFDPEAQNKEFYDALDGYKADFDSDPEEAVVTQNDALPWE